VGEYNITPSERENTNEPLVIDYPDDEYVKSRRGSGGGRKPA